MCDIVLRLWALTAVHPSNGADPCIPAFRGIVDGNPAAAEVSEKIKAMVKQQMLTGLDPEEKAAFGAPHGSLGQRDRMQLNWAAEGMGVLAWAIRRAELPIFCDKIPFQRVSAALGAFQSGELHYSDNSGLRDLDEIEEAFIQYALLHWRLSMQAWEPGSIDFASKLENPQFGRMVIEGLELVDSDMSIDGVRIDEVEEHRMYEVLSIATERYKALRWLLGYDRSYVTLPPVLN